MLALVLWSCCGGASAAVPTAWDHVYPDTHQPPETVVGSRFEWIEPSPQFPAGPAPGPDAVPLSGHPAWPSDAWDWRLFPGGIVYPNYLAGVHESRMASTWFHDDRLGWQWDVALGGRAGLLRFGTADPLMPEGWQLDIEGAAFPRLDLVDGRRELTSSDFRFGIPLTYGDGPYRMKFAYYHISSHLGDERMQRTGEPRINYVRDGFVWGHSWYFTPEVRAYAEAAWAFHTDGGAQPWEFQFGLDYAPCCPTGIAGAPFLALNVHLREEVDFGGNFVVQAGWAWRGARGQLLRAGLHYYNGKSPQFQFFDQFEQQIGLAMWYDF